MKRAAITFSILLAGCAATGPVQNSASMSGATDKLPPQNLAPGECGLFVWTADAARNFILFSQSGEKTGLWVSGGVIEQLSIETEAGRSANTQFPQTNYISDAGKKIGLSLEQRQTIIDGTRYKRGFLRVKTDADWTRITPVVGLSACQK